MKRKYKVALILHNLRSVYNTASIFRTSDAAAVDKIYLVGTTPTPIDRFKRKRKDFAKVALGAEETVPWEYWDNIKELIEQLKKDGYEIIALEQDKNSVDYKTIKAQKNIAIMVGNEPDGIDKQTLGLADKIIEIPMLGKKESLNVSVALGIALFRILNI